MKMVGGTSHRNQVAIYFRGSLLALAIILLMGLLMLTDNNSRHFHRGVLTLSKIDVERESVHPKPAQLHSKTPSKHAAIPHTGSLPQGTDSPLFKVVIVAMETWRDSTALPRRVTCDGFEKHTILLDKVNQELTNVNSADILLFAGEVTDRELWLNLQHHRQARQSWVFSTGESPFNVRRAMPPRTLTHIRFNISSTYHPSAHIFVPYGQFTEHFDSGGSFHSYFDEKRGLIAWISSHCDTPMWRRFDLVRDLAGLIPVHTYGECGTLSCAYGDSRCKDIFKTYKFIVAFENSCCGGYITEKFWNALAIYNAIPVVVGAPKKDYQKQAPPDSFIHADDFDSMADLADYILKVSRDRELYDTYFKWRTLGKATKNRFVDIIATSDLGLCRLYKYLKKPSADPQPKYADENSFDPYGSNWLGGCDQCGNHLWIRNYSNYLSFNKLRTRF